MFGPPRNPFETAGVHKSVTLTGRGATLWWT